MKAQQNYQTRLQAHQAATRLLEAQLDELEAELIDQRKQERQAKLQEALTLLQEKSDQFNGLRDQMLNLVAEIRAIAGENQSLWAEFDPNGFNGELLTINLRSLGFVGQHQVTLPAVERLPGSRGFLISNQTFRHP